MPAYPIAELVTRNVVATLQAVTTWDGEGAAPLVVERYNTRGNAPGDLKTIVSVGADEESDDADTPAGFKQWRRPYDIFVHLIEPEDSEVPYDQLVDVVRADIEKALMADVTRGGYAVNTEIRAPQFIPNETDISGIVVRCEILYRTKEDDPYQRT